MKVYYIYYKKFLNNNNSNFKIKFYVHNEVYIEQFNKKYKIFLMILDSHDIIIKFLYFTETKMMIYSHFNRQELIVFPPKKKLLEILY